tara:strand:+ start:349 stop:570 length:222 start_codon:yes stop_codon:yes gene_type:complete
VIDFTVPDTYRIFGKVRVADILSQQAALDRTNWLIAFNKISAKHFDYVLCCQDTREVIAAIELAIKPVDPNSS